MLCVVFLVTKETLWFTGMTLFAQFLLLSHWNWNAAKSSQQVNHCLIIPYHLYHFDNICILPEQGTFVDLWPWPGNMW